MRTKDIRFVKCIEYNGIIYSWFVAHKNKNISDSRIYDNYENGKTVIKEYKKENLPKFVQRFIDTHEKSITSEYENGYTHYIYR